MTHHRYVLITPARNEEAYIEKTIQAIISQTILPEKWIIVSDRSTDQTENIVRKYANEWDFIELLRVQGDRARNVGSKVRAIHKARNSWLRPNMSSSATSMRIFLLGLIIMSRC